MNLYFDNAASCRPFDWAAELFYKTSLDFFANQEASGFLGKEAENLVRNASRRLAEALAPGADVLWCNTGTESLATAVRAHCQAYHGTEIITTEAEHPALKKAIQYFADSSKSTVKFAKIKRNGTVDPDSLRSLLNPKTSLFAVHHVNAETGVIQDLRLFREILEDSGCSGTAFLADTTQSVGKIAIPWTEAKLDYMTLSGCKIGAPGGAALLFRDTADRTRSKRLHTLRSSEHAVGRCVPAAAHVISKVAEAIIPPLSERAERTAKLRTRILNALRTATAGKLEETIPEELASPYILHVMFPNLQGAILVRMLNSEGISAASGSACMAETPTASAVLTAMGYSKAMAFGAFRLSFWDDSTEKDAEVFENLFESALKNY